MNKKQKKMLARILTAAALLVGLNFVPVTGLAKLGLYLIPYLIIGYDILLKALKGKSSVKRAFRESLVGVKRQTF